MKNLAAGKLWGFIFLLPVFFYRVLYCFGAVKRDPGWKVWVKGNDGVGKLLKRALKTD